MPETVLWKWHRIGDRDGIVKVKLARAAIIV
jgi:hypothetical protein